MRFEIDHHSNLVPFYICAVFLVGECELFKHQFGDSDAGQTKT